MYLEVFRHPADSPHTVVVLCGVWDVLPCATTPSTTVPNMRNAKQQLSYRIGRKQCGLEALEAKSEIRTACKY